jgi:hypothetical protein
VPCRKNTACGVPDPGGIAITAGVGRIRERPGFRKVALAGLGADQRRARA